MLQMWSKSMPKKNQSIFDVGLNPKGTRKLFTQNSTCYFMRDSREPDLITYLGQLFDIARATFAVWFVSMSVKEWRCFKIVTRTHYRIEYHNLVSHNWSFLRQVLLRLRVVLLRNCICLSSSFSLRWILQKHNTTKYGNQYKLMVELVKKTIN